MSTPAPKYFVAEEESASNLDPAAFRRLIDLFRDASGRTRAVVVTATGALALADADQPGSLPPDVAVDVNHARLAAPLRVIRAASIHLFAMERLEPAADHPGVDDPLSLEGQLYGPFPSEQPMCRKGHLSTTRYDLLDALVRGARFALYSRIPGPGGTASRWLHLALAADDEGEILEGRGLVLIYPLVRQSLEIGDTGNEQPVVELAHAVLEAMKGDPCARGTPIAATEVPAPSRAELVKRLEALGYAIEGDVALKKRAGVLGRFFREEIPVPPHATLDDLLRIAREVLALVADRPTPRLRSLNRRIIPPFVSWTARDPLGLRPVGAEPVAFRIERGHLVVPRPKAGASLSKAKRLEKSWRAIYFDVEDSYADRGGVDLQMELVVSDDDEGQLFVEYDTEHNIHHPGPFSVKLDGKKGKRKIAFSMPVPRMRGRQNFGADFRLVARTLGDLRIERLTLRDANPHQITVLRETSEDAPAVVPIEATETLPARAVYFDDRYGVSWVHQPSRLAVTLSGKGYAVLDADQLQDWMGAAIARGAAGTMVIMAHGIVPDTVMQYPDKRALIRRYLEEGGRVVWIGDIPFHHLGARDGSIKRSGGSSAGGVLDIDTAGRDLSKAPKLSAEGRRWRMSLIHEDASVNAVRIRDVTHALSVVGRDYAASWVKRFGASAKPGDFIRYRAASFDGADEADLIDLLRVANHGLDRPPKMRVAVELDRDRPNGAITVELDTERAFGTWGRTPVEVMISKERFRTTISSAAGAVTIAIPEQVKRALRLEDREEVDVEIRLDGERLIEAPADLQVVLSRNAKAAKAWDKLGRDWRRQIAGRLENAGASKRATEVERVVASLEK